MGILDYAPQEYEYKDYRAQLNASFGKLAGAVGKRVGAAYAKPPPTPQKPANLKAGYKPPVNPKPAKLKAGYKPPLPPRPPSSNKPTTLKGGIPALKKAPLPEKGAPIVRRPSVSKKVKPDVPARPTIKAEVPPKPVVKSEPPPIFSKSPASSRITPSTSQKLPPKITEASPASKSPANQMQRVKNLASLEALQREAAKTYKPMPMKSAPQAPKILSKSPASQVPKITAPKITEPSPARKAFDLPGNQLKRVKNLAALESVQRQAAKTYKPMKKRK